MRTPVLEPPGEGAIADILLRIVERRRQRLDEATRDSGELPLLGTGEPCTVEDNAFLAALAARRAAGRPAVIAEVKMASPRLGSLAGRVDPVEQARLYAANGASALSVVVEPDFFGGSYELLAECRQASGLPTLAKDFVVDPLQLWWAKRAAADAVLLIAALYDRRELLAYAGMARHLGLVPLIELHGSADLAKLVGESWELVGVNNRDLRTFVVSLEHSESLAPELPAGALRVAESGLSGHDQIARLATAGFDAFLIGESLLLSSDPAALLRELLG
jgi:indole-3-glycerol phosphate synthase